MTSMRSAICQPAPRRRALPSAAFIMLMLCALTLPELANAQDGAQAPLAEETPAEGEAEAEAPAPVETFSVSVKLTSEGDVAEQAVLLFAARPKGPFEPTDPKPAHEWTAITDAQGVAVFDQIPRTVMTSGLRLHATTFQNGHVFKSGQLTPAPGLQLNIGIYQQGHSLEGVVIKDVQIIAHVWENHIFFQHFYRLSTEGDRLIDTAQLPGRQLDNGLPLRLPVKASGIQVDAPGETRVVNSTVYWKGVLKPGDTVPVSVAFSIPADHTTFTYEQEFDYPVRQARIMVPLEPSSPQVKIPYFDTVSLAAPGFKVEAAEGGLSGQNQGKFLVADDASFEPGQALSFQLTGLPFDELTAAWIALLLGLAGMLVALAYSRREQQHIDKSRTSAAVADMLRAEREELLDELALLEQDYEDGEVGDLEYERESLLLRGRIALVMRKIAEIEAAIAPSSDPEAAA